MQNVQASARSSRSIDNYIKRLDLKNQTLGKSTREIKLYNGGGEIRVQMGHFTLEAGLQPLLNKG